jgi:hypothetical protein
MNYYVTLSSLRKLRWGLPHKASSSCLNGFPSEDLIIGKVALLKPLLTMSPISGVREGALKQIWQNRTLRVADVGRPHAIGFSVQKLLGGTHSSDCGTFQINLALLQIISNDSVKPTWFDGTRINALMYRRILFPCRMMAAASICVRPMACSRSDRSMARVSGLLRHAILIVNASIGSCTKIVIEGSSSIVLFHVPAS